MARKPTTFNPGALELLKEFVKRKVNLSCNCFSHIQQLEENIRITTGEFLSLQTLNRFFGIIPNGFNPSLNTLDTLARYAGFYSFAEIETISENSSDKQQENSELLRILSFIFTNIEASTGNESGVFRIMENLVRLINRDPVFGKLIYSNMAKVSSGRIYLFERLVFMDQLAGLYGESLPVCLLYASNREQKFFVLNMFCYKYFLMGDKKMFDNYFQLLINYPQSEVMRFKPDIIDRYYAVIILNEAFRNERIDKGNMHIALPDLDCLSSHPGYHPHTRFLLGEALLLAGQFEQANELLSKQPLHLEPKGELDKAYYETSIAVYKLVCGYFSRQINSKKAFTMCHQLLNRPLPLLAADFLSLILWSLLLELEPKNAEKKICRDKIDALVKKTKFSLPFSFLQISASRAVE